MSRDANDVWDILFDEVFSYYLAASPASQLGSLRIFFPAFSCGHSPSAPPILKDTYLD
jgi:hypothetical protein